MLVLPLVLVMGCQKAPEETTDTFLATYDFSEKGRSMAISGDSTGMPGEQSEYTITFHNDIERWQDEYYILLIDSKSVIKEISHEHIDIGPMTTVLKPFTVEYPSGFEGALGLCVVTHTHPATLIAKLSIGVKDAINTGWPDIGAYVSTTTN